MKNLKKVLALVMVFAMAMTMFAGAAEFTDVAEIDPAAQSSVDTFSSLGILKGFEDKMPLLRDNWGFSV